MTGYEIRKRPEPKKHMKFSECVYDGSELVTAGALRNMKVLTAQLAKRAALSSFSPSEAAEHLTRKGFNVTAENVESILCGKTVPAMKTFITLSRYINGMP